MISGAGSSAASPASSEAFDASQTDAAVAAANGVGMDGVHFAQCLKDDDALNWYEDAVRFAAGGAFTPVEDVMRFGAGVGGASGLPQLDAAAAAAASTNSVDGAAADVLFDDFGGKDNFGLTG